MMQTGDEKTIQAQQRLEDFVKNYKIFIDTCSLLYEGADLFWKNIVPILEREQVKIIVPLRVIEEVQKIKTDQSKELATRERATNVEKTLEFLKSAKLIEIRGEPSDKFADNVFNTVFTKFRTDYNLLLITQDRDLGVDILKLNESKSVRGKKISVQRITHYGFLGKIEPKPGEGVSGNISKNNMSNKANAFNPKAVR
jgi:rRNA-processing protein FCF1